MYTVFGAAEVQDLLIRRIKIRQLSDSPSSLEETSLRVSPGNLKPYVKPSRGQDETLTLTLQNWRLKDCGGRILKKILSHGNVFFLIEQ